MKTAQKTFPNLIIRLKPIPTVSSRARRNQTPQQSKAEQNSPLRKTYLTPMPKQQHGIPFQRANLVMKRSEAHRACLLAPRQ